HRFTRLIDKLDTVSPLATLSRGYSITQTAQGKIVRQATDVKTGDQLITRLADGDVHSTVN
ncbi:MAG: exodeoxyribonuclease VII large subunit, partial [Vibrio fluvialis]